MNIHLISTLCSRLDFILHKKVDTMAKVGVTFVDIINSARKSKQTTSVYTWRPLAPKCVDRGMIFLPGPFLLKMADHQKQSKPSQNIKQNLALTVWLEPISQTI